VALVACAVLTTVAGGLLGRVASRRVLAPLGDVTTAAASISAGDMDTRLSRTEDPDLATLVGSFNNMVDALDERIQRDARFAADVSHELRTPVTTLVTSLSVLHEAPDLPPRSRHALELMSHELDRFRRSLEDLLALGRLDAGVQESQVAPARLTELVRQSLDASGRDPRLLHVDPPSADPVVMVDRRQVARALINLYDNADVHGAGLTSVSVAVNGEYADVYVDDRGTGVRPEDRQRVFDRFARLGQRGSATGTGLGLSIVEQTLTHHGGAVWCTDNPGGGARFVARLPTAPERQDDPV
jgi:signal transduction histidine kinase